MPPARRVAFATAALLAGALAVAGFWPSGVRARAALDRIQAQNDLRQVAHAIDQYERANGSRPASAAFLAPDGKPLLSWRVAVLPFLEHGALYAQFELDEPFDGPHNAAVARDHPMPRLYDVPGAPAPPGFTRVVGFAAERKGRRVPMPAFDLAAPGLRLADFKDGPFNTVQLVLAETPVPWTAPADLPFEVGANHSALLHWPANWGRTTAVATADGKAQLVPADTTPARLQALLTRDGND